MDELLGRKTPHSAPAEQAVIGSMLIDSRCIPEVLEKLKPDEFYIQLNRDIYETIYAMFSYSMAIDPVTVLGQMKVRGVYKDNCEEYLAEIMRITPTAANVLEYAAIVRDRALLRRLGEAADEISSMVYEGSGEAETMLEAAERKIYALRQGRNVGGLIPVSSVVQNVFDTLSEAASSGNAIPGLSTGLADLDRVTLGLNKSELILIAARPGGAGKLFGAVTSQEICDALKAQFGIEIEKNKIVQADPIKTFGSYQVKAKLGYEVSGTVNVLVIEDK